MSPGVLYRCVCCGFTAGDTWRLACAHCVDAKRNGATVSKLVCYCSPACQIADHQRHKINCTKMRHRYNCANCSTPSLFGIKLPGCSACIHAIKALSPRGFAKAPHYCNSECQKQHWRAQHKHHCFRSLRPTVSNLLDLDDCSTVATDVDADALASMIDEWDNEYLESVLSASSNDSTV